MKTKHANAANAYLEYELSKTCIRVFALANYADDHFVAASEIQARINKYAELLIAQGAAASDAGHESIILGSESMSPSAFGWRHHETLRFLGFERKFFVDLAHGNYKERLRKNARLMSWQNLERLMVAEKRNTPLAAEPYSSVRLNELSARFGLIFVSVAKASITTPIIDALFSSFSQLVSVVGCRDYEIGAYQFSYFIETGNEASNFDEFYKTQRIELNDFLESGAFSHEWGHGIDNLLAPHFGESYSGFASDSRKQNPVNLLVSASKLPSLPLDEAKIASHIARSKSNIYRIMEYSNRTNGYTDYRSFLKSVDDALSSLSDKDWEKSSFRLQAIPHVRAGRSSLKIITSEIELIRSLLEIDAAPFSQSVFFKFAEILNTNFDYCYKGYWTEKREMFARAFEAYVDFQLEARGEQPLDCLNFVSWQPDSKETQAWLPQWNEVMNLIREKLNEVSTANRAAQANRSEIETTEGLAV